MRDPVRILDSADATDLERQLIASWRDERPPPNARSATLAALGFAANAPTATATATTLTFFKWLAILVVAAGIVAALIAGSSTHDAQSVSRPTSTVAHVPLQPVLVSTSLRAADDSPRPSQPSPKAVRAQQTTSLADEVARIDRARQALDSGDAPTAMTLVDAYEARYPGGAFVQEADVLRIEALLRLGKVAEGTRAIHRFLASHTDSPHEPRLRKLLETLGS